MSSSTLRVRICAFASQCRSTLRHQFEHLVEGRPKADGSNCEDAAALRAFAKSQDELLTSELNALVQEGALVVHTVAGLPRRVVDPQILCSFHNGYNTASIHVPAIRARRGRPISTPLAARKVYFSSDCGEALINELLADHQRIIKKDRSQCGKSALCQVLQGSQFAHNHLPFLNRLKYGYRSAIDQGIQFAATALLEPLPVDRKSEVVEWFIPDTCFSFELSDKRRFSDTLDLYRGAAELTFLSPPAAQEACRALWRIPPRSPLKRLQMFHAVAKGCFPHVLEQKGIVQEKKVSLHFILG